VIRVVFDPGVLVSAFISPRAAPAELVQAWRDGRFELVVSPKLLEELRRVLLRPKFRRYATEQEVQEYVAHLKEEGHAELDPAIPVGATPDPKDDYLVGLARAANAHILVSGDQHLTRLEDPHPPVLTPRALLDQLYALSEGRSKVAEPILYEDAAH